MTYLSGFFQLAFTKTSYLRHFLRPSPHQQTAKYGPHGSHILEVFPCEHKLGKDAPVLAFVHGGAWGSGHPYMYRLLGVRLAMEGFHCVLIGYRTYPCADICGQIDDVQEALKYMYANLAKGTLSVLGKNSPIYLSGHSSGAHVATHTMLKRSTALPFIQGVIGLAGPYHLRSQYLCEQAKGVHEMSPLKAANRGESKFDEHSPSLILEKLDGKTIRKLPRFMLLHGQSDATVPPAQSERMAEAAAKSGVRCRMEILEGVTHAGIVTDLFDLERKFGYLETIKRFCGACVATVAGQEEKQPMIQLQQGKEQTYRQAESKKKTSRDGAIRK
eukprot:CAMPEP_0170197570 /NCGR_PEP_ID=MMETSP0040_2-20121228/66675_1 /TAXON_ID=641309 /ORGANISM="Lotharella oceanica, Strain CCMP622" /LENGTH=329 /DNA_ID=CAMNT_0010447269 /DNA_START=62 /DNA_END=1051 /DNA_ORIENTATION=+